MDKYTTMSISAQVHPSSLKTMPDTCNKFALDVANQLAAHRNKQLEQQKTHEQRITRILSGRQGIWLSNRWAKILFVFLAVYTLIILFYVKFG